MNTETVRTDYLFPKRDFFSGLSGILNIFGNNNHFNTSNTDQEADEKALRNDWEMVGNDFKNVMIEEISSITNE